METNAFIKNTSDVRINPATEGTLEDIKNVLINDPFSGYGIYKFDETYIMFQNSSDAWIILNIATDSVTYSKGSSDTPTNWTNRASQTYADYATTF